MGGRAGWLLQPLATNLARLPNPVPALTPSGCNLPQHHLQTVCPFCPLLPSLPFQLHGTCLGFETLAIIAAKNHSILEEFDSENLPSPLFYTDVAAKRPVRLRACPCLCACGAA